MQVGEVAGWTRGSRLCQLLPFPDRAGADELSGAGEVGSNAKLGRGAAGLEDGLYQLLIPVRRLDK